ncbi:hypothetical protein [Candidatus Albibeggiatoa sp. nov. BB20]
MPFVAAISLNKDAHPISMNIVEGFKTKGIAAWAEHHFSTECEFVSDGLV